MIPVRPDTKGIVCYWNIDLWMKTARVSRYAIDRIRKILPQGEAAGHHRFLCRRRAAHGGEVLRLPAHRVLGHSVRRPRVDHQRGRQRLRHRQYPHRLQAPGCGPPLRPRQGGVLFGRFRGGPDHSGRVRHFHDRAAPHSEPPAVALFVGGALSSAGRGSGQPRAGHRA